MALLHPWHPVQVFHKYVVQLLFLSGQDRIPHEITVEFLDYYDRDYIKLKLVELHFRSATWLSDPLVFHKDYYADEEPQSGWANTNKESYEEGGAIVKVKVTMKDTGN